MGPIKDRIETKLSVEWLIDKFWPIAWVAFGSSLTAYFSYVTDWLSRLGPIVYLVAVFLGGYLSLGIYYLVQKTMRAKIENEFAKKALSNNSANPLSSSFDKQVVKIPDFYSPYYITHKKKTFNNCQIIGPGNVLLGGSVLQYGDFRECQIVILNHNPKMRLFNVTAFEDCSFINCQIINITILMTKENYAQLPPDAKQYVPVISGTIL